MIVPIGIALAVAVLAAILVLLIRRKLSEKYAVLWLVIGLATLLLALFPGLLVWFSEVLGVQVASNLLFAMSLVLLIGVTLHLSWELSKSEEEVRRVAEEVAILRADVDALQGSAYQQSAATQRAEAVKPSDATQEDGGDEASA
jgi:hypothetical protein